jgi:hypothetical protein
LADAEPAPKKNVRPPNINPRPLKRTLRIPQPERNRFSRWPALLFASLALLLALQSVTFAHAFLDHAEPKVGSEVSPVPTSVKIWFTQKIEPAFSKIQVFDADGHEVDAKDCHLDDKDHSLLIVSLPKLGAGTYKVVWGVVSVDTHRTKGDFKFVVK